MNELPKDIERELRRIMEPDERLIDFRKEPWSLYKRHRWVILTSQRVYLIKKVFFGISFDIIQIILAQAHLEMVEGIVLDTIYIRVTSEPEHILNFSPTERARTLIFFEEIEKAREGDPEARVVAQAELEALARVFYENVISKEEYEEKKRELLKKM